MKTISLPQFWMPENISSAPDITGSIDVDINGPNDYFAYVFSMPETAIITACFFKLFSVATGGDVQVRLESVSPTELLPTGSPIDTNAVVTKTISTTTNDYSATFPAPVTIQAGTMVAYVIKGVSATVSAFVATFSDSHNSTTIPICIDYDSATTIARRISAAPLIGIKTGTYGIPIRHTWPISSVGVKTVSSTTPYTAVGNQFQLVNQAWTIAGARFWLSMAAGATAKLVLYDYYLSIIQSVDLPASTPASSSNYMREVYFNTPVTVLGGIEELPEYSTYYLAIEGTSNASVSLAIMQSSAITDPYYKASPLNWILRGSESNGFGLVNSFSQAFITPIVTNVADIGLPLPSPNTSCFAS